MKKSILRKEDLEDFRRYLILEEKSEITIEKYLRDTAVFRRFLQGRELSKEAVMSFKKQLMERGYAVRSVNSMLASVNSLLRFLEREDCRVKSIRIQPSPFCPEEKELNKDEYFRLLDAAKKRPAALSDFADHLRHRHPRFGAGLFYRGIGKAGQDHRSLQGKNTGGVYPLETPGKACEIHPQTAHLFRSDLSLPQGEPASSVGDLAGDEIPLQKSDGESRQGVPPQSAQAFRPHLLRPRERSGETRRYSRPQQHQHHADLHCDHRSGASTEDRPFGTCGLRQKKLHNFHYVCGAENNAKMPDKQKEKGCAKHTLKLF